VFKVSEEELMNVKSNLQEILLQLMKTEKAQTSSDASRQYYVDLHRERFADILQICRSYVGNPSARVLDVGKSEFTAHLLKLYSNVTTLGIDLSTDDGGHREVSRMETVPHIAFDLLNSNQVDKWPESGAFDLIVFSEVLEHLSVAPEFVFALLNSLLADTGILICTTPNAADVAKRVRLACGGNPFERIRLYSTNPGHIREYTRHELYHIAQSVGLECVRHRYFDWPQSIDRNRIKDTCMKLVRSYPPFRGSSVAVFRRMMP
jgi:2-polyprenyl-3-methyl-5-hydroxy-6-metoxy-1,4-benzoquinol methylase